MSPRWLVNGQPRQGVDPSLCSTDEGTEAQRGKVARWSQTVEGAGVGGRTAGQQPWWGSLAGASAEPELLWEGLADDIWGWLARWLGR